MTRSKRDRIKYLGILDSPWRLVPNLALLIHKTVATYSQYAYHKTTDNKWLITNVTLF